MIINETELNLISRHNSINPKYVLNTNHRELDVYCFSDGRIVFHGYYGCNYSFFVMGIKWMENVDYFSLISRVFFDEWDFVTSYPAAFDILGMSYEEAITAYQLSYFRNDNHIAKSSRGNFYTKVDEFLDQKPEVTISNQINEIYTNKVSFDECKTIAELDRYKTELANCQLCDIRDSVKKIESILNDKQYLLFGDERVRNLCIDCWRICGEKYNEYMNAFH